jgi:hypothetical protein
MKGPISYYVIRYIAAWLDLIDAAVAIISFTTFYTHFGLAIRGWEATRRVK